MPSRLSSDKCPQQFPRLHLALLPKTWSLSLTPHTQPASSSDYGIS